ncbi:MAG: glycosyltransferase [Planctomycetota bacterium]
MPDAEISALITNYNTGPLMVRCVESLIAQRTPGRTLEVLVIDDDSFLDQRPYLEQARRHGARVLELDRNQGHGGACNRGFEASTGQFVFLINSDTVACEGALARLVEHLDTHAQVGFVEPRTYIDDDRTFVIPEIFRPRPGEAAWVGLSGLYAERLGLQRARRWVATWQSSQPQAQEHLTGAFLGARRDVIERLGGYDEGYPLYYEDSDMFARARGVDLELCLLPTAEVVHYGHRSVAMIWEEAMHKSQIGRARYMRRHHGRVGAWLDSSVDGAMRHVRRLRVPRPRRRAIELGKLEAPPTLTPTTDDRPYLLELAFDPFFLLSCGRFCDPGPTTLSAATWDSLFETTHYLRALSLDSWESMGTWVFEKG